MVTNRVLLFGGQGQLGKALQSLVLPSDWHLKSVTRTECDFMRPSDIGRVFHDFSPDIVINAAAMTNIKACEQNPQAATETNFHAVAHIAGQCDTMNAPLIHLSTDYVFDGKEDGHYYSPDDAMNPVNVYGQTKMMGEEAVRHGLHWHVILRTSSIFSAFGNNILTKILRQIDAQDEVQALTDQKSNPTNATALSESLIRIADSILKGKGNGFGTFHYCGTPAVNRYEFLQAVMDAYAPFTRRRPRFMPITSADAPNRVKRPANSMLNCDKIRDVYGLIPRDWREDLEQMIKTYLDGVR